MSEPSANQLPWHWLGRLSYAEGTQRQEALRDRLVAGDESAACLLLLEHEPVITLGRRGSQESILAAPEELSRRGIALLPSTRGGDVTYHGPGQLMVYPVVRIQRVVGFLEAVANGLAQIAEELGVPGARWQRDPAGLWLGTAKLAACGVHLRRWVTSHGFAFNVSTPPEPWQLIVPCGLADRSVISIAQARHAAGLPPPPPVAEVAEGAAPILCAALQSVRALPKGQ